MQTNYQLEEEDLVTYFLYTASKSELQQRRIKRSKYAVPAVLVAIGIAMAFLGDYNQGILFAIVAILWFMFYPPYLKRSFVKHYKKVVSETFKKSLGKNAFIDFSDGQIYCKDDGVESKVSFSEIEEISEISDYVFVKLQSGTSYVFCKKRLENPSAWLSYFRNLSLEQNIPYNAELDWKWN